MVNANRRAKMRGGPTICAAGQVGIEDMEGLDLTSIYTTIGGVLGTPAAIAG